MFHFRDESRTALIVATGPSAGLADLRRAIGWPCLVVNDAYRLVPTATALYACDTRWWTHHIGAVRSHFTGSLWAGEEKAARDYGLNGLTVERQPGLSVTPGVVRAGGTIGNSGAQAINLATLWGARRLILIGFDMHDRGLPHFFGHHPKGLQVSTPYSLFVRQMHPMAAALSAAGIEVINTSLQSALPYWPRRDLAEVLPTPPPVAPTLAHLCPLAPT